MSEPFGIEPLERTIELRGDDAAGVVEVDVTNHLDRHVHAAVEVKAEHAPEGGSATVEPESFALDANESRRIRLHFTPLPGAGEGEYPISLRIYEVDRPSEVFSEGPPITVSVESETKEKRTSPWIFVALGLPLALIVAGTVWLLLPSDVEVPDVRGYEVEEARAVLEGAGLNVQEGTFETPHDTIPPGHVVALLPAAAQVETLGEPLPEGTVVPTNTIVFMDVSTGPFTVPDVVGAVESTAEHAIRFAAGEVYDLGVSVIDEEPNDEIEAGRVVRTDPAVGDTVSLAGGDAEVGLVLSSGPAETWDPPVVERIDPRVGELAVAAVPDLTNLSRDQARQRLENAGLELGSVEEVGQEPPILGRWGRWVVEHQQPSPSDTVPIGTSVDLWLNWVRRE